MNPEFQPPPVNQSSPPPAPSVALAVASLVLGILALLSSIVLIGAFFGLIGLVLGMLHLARRTGRNGLAWAGIVLSALGIVASIGVAAWAVPKVKTFFEKTLVQLAAEESGFEDWKGVAAPDFTVKTLDGTQLKLSDLRSKRVIVDFWATWCPPCVKEIPHFIQLRKEFPETELAILGISNEDEATLRDFVRRKGINYPIASADDLPAPYKNVTAIPTTFFIDRRGVIQEVLVGYHDLASLRKHATAPDSTGEPKPAPTTGEEPPTTAPDSASPPSAAGRP